MKAQPLLHGCFLSFLLAFGLGFAQGTTDFKERMEARDWLQTATFAFVAKHSRPPTSIEELILASPYAGSAYEKLSHEPIQFLPFGEGKFRIIFSGPDNIFGTLDDVHASDKLIIGDVLNRNLDKN